MHDLHANGPPTSDADEEMAPAVRIDVANETDVEVDVHRLGAAIRTCFFGSLYKDISVSVAIVDDETIHELNRQFLDHDYPTDVLCFPLEYEPPRLSGEVIVSLDTAARCAAHAGWDPADELLLYVVHGALHLAGYRDKSAADAAQMRAAEAAVLAKLGVSASAHDSRWSGGDEEDDSP